MTPINKTLKKHTLKPVTLAISLSLLSACGGGASGEGSGGEGGIIGTAKIPTITALTTLHAKSKSGHRLTTSIASNGKFSLNNAKNEAYLIRTKPAGSGKSARNGINDYFYGIAHSNGQSAVTRNIHPFTDLIIRNWFSTKSLDINTEFDKAGEITQMPTVAEINAIESEIEGIVSKLLNDYGISDGIDLLATPFDTNGSGFDNFLNNNEVIINNNQITLIFNQSNSETEGVGINKLPLTTDFTTSNDNPPTIPTKVRALPASNTEIVIVWEASTDDKGVAGYDIYRNGTLIGSSPYPVFTDTGLSSNTNYSYEVIAIDGRAQQSPITLATTPITLDTPDVNAPPSATSLSANVSGDDINLSWTQSQINDVSSFIIKRGAPGSANTQIAQITSTEFTNFNLPQSNTPYCYRVTSVDASGNRSTPSNEACGSVGGTTGPTTPLVCIDYTETTITTDTTFDKPCYNMKSNLTVEGGATLTIKPGVTLKFSALRQIRVRSDGALNAVGTSTKPIIFTGAQKTPGYWYGIIYYNSNYVKNELKYVTMEYGGSTNANLDVDSSSRIKISHSTFSHSANHGIRFYSGAIIDQFSNNTITDNEDAPIRIYANHVGKLDSQSSYTGNATNKDYISVSESSVIEKDQTWHALNVPYKLANHDVEASLSIEPGTKMIFKQGGGFRITREGSFKANGTASKKITFTGENKTPGSWQGLRFIFNGGANELNHAVIDYAGSTDGNGDGAVSLFSTPGRLKMHNTTISNSLQYGLDIDHPRHIIDLANNNFTNNEKGSLLVAPDLLGRLDKNTNYNDPIVWASGGDIDTDQTIQNLGVPYHVSRHDIDGHVSIEAGTHLIFNANGWLSVRSAGALTAIGTANSPIVFTGKQQVSGSWVGLDFFSNSRSNQLDHTIIEYAGAPTGNAQGLVGAFFSDSYVDVTNSTLRHSASNGFWLHNPNSGTYTDNIFENIADDNIFIENP